MVVASGSRVTGWFLAGRHPCLHEESNKLCHERTAVRVEVRGVVAVQGDVLVRDDKHRDARAVLAGHKHLQRFQASVNTWSLLIHIASGHAAAKNMHALHVLCASKGSQQHARISEIKRYS